MDGFGKNESTYGNAIAAAKKPNLDKIVSENPMTFIGASGLDVGLPDGQMGNLRSATNSTSAPAEWSIRSYQIAAKVHSGRRLFHQ